MQKVRITRNDKHDCMGAEVIIGSPYGAVQTRAVVPLAKLRNLVMRRYGNRSNMSGNVESAVTKLGEHCAKRLIMGAASVAQKSAQNSRKASLAKRVAKIVAFVLAGGLVSFGSWEAFRAAMSAKRKQKARADLQRGANARGVAQSLARGMAEDELVFDAVETQLSVDDEGDEGEDTEVSGFNPLKVATTALAMQNPAAFIAANAAKNAFRRRRKKRQDQAPRQDSQEDESSQDDESTDDNQQQEGQ